MSDTMIPSTSTAPARTVVRGDSTDSIHWARKAARTFTDRLSPAPDPDLADTLVLVVSELATNALRHGGGRFTLRLSAGPGTVTAAVSDPSPARPRGRTPDLDGATGGFGWHMINRLTEALTITPGPGAGKTVCAQFAR
ncbi:ATP-binding protein [Streptomyces sp. HB132]|uniref:ATP-binding protein n=1 Tax=Streptomyces sp. HB132 TaxID=767388 RepID=UPI0019622519|nr:ATP-binding protein [Streptomyces sp. HB132]MBM7437799.1 anti-sigma regulatory factor (Ser/Thr protein kinase) [Streptomyces sp. HB132]